MAAARVPAGNTQSCALDSLTTYGCLSDRAIPDTFPPVFRIVDDAYCGVYR